MKKLEDVLKDFLPVNEWGQNLTNPITGNPEPITGDRVKKLLPKMNEKHWTFFGGRYYVWKYAPDPRQRNPDGTVHWGRTKQ